MAPKKPRQKEGAADSNVALLDDAERIRQAAEEALWLESAEEGLDEVDVMWQEDNNTGAGKGEGDEEEEGEEGEVIDPEDEETRQKLPPTHETVTLRQVAKLANEELANPAAFPVLHPEYGRDVRQASTMEWKCVYGKRGAKYEGTLSVYRSMQRFGLVQPEGGDENDEDEEIRVKNKQSSSMVQTMVLREYINGRGVHQALLGDQYAGEWWGGLRQGHGTQTWINREHIQTLHDIDFYRRPFENNKTLSAFFKIYQGKVGKRRSERLHPFYTGPTKIAYLHDKMEEPGWIRPEDGELRGKRGAFPDVYQWTTADNLVGTYTGQWYRDTPEGCGVMVWSDGTSLAGEWRRGAYIGNFPVCTPQEADFHMRLGQLAAQKAKMFQYKPQDMTVIHEKPHLWQHPYFYDDGDQWRAPGPIHKYYEVPPEYKARVERMDAEREAWLDGWKNAGKDHPDWQQQWTAIEAVEQQNLVQVNFGEPSPLMELAEQAQKTDTDDVHEQLRLSAAARGAYIPSVRELKELAPGRNLGPGQLLTQLAQGKAPPLGMEDIEATIQFVDKYGEEGLIGVDDETEDGRTRPMTVERARELLLNAIPETLLKDSQRSRGAYKTLEPPPVNLLRLETHPMRAAFDKDSPEYAQKVKERVLRRAEEALQELNDQLQAALRLKRLHGLPIELDEAQRDYLRKVKDEYQLRFNAIRERRLRAVMVDEVPAQEGNMGGLDLSDVERKARLEQLQRGRERALLPGEEEVVGGQELGWQEKEDRKVTQALAEREEEADNILVLPGMKPDELRKTQKHAQRFYNLELEATGKLLEFSRLLENYSRVPHDQPLEKPSPTRPPLVPAHAPGQVLNPLPPVNTPVEAAEAIMSAAYKAGYAPLTGFNKLIYSLMLRKGRPTHNVTAVEAYAEYLEELPVRSKLEWTADAAPRVAGGPNGEVIEADDNFEYQDSLERLRAERAQLAEEIRREQDALREEEANTYVANVLDLARREAAALQANKLDSRFWGDQSEDEKKKPIQEWEPKQIGKSDEELVAASRSIQEEIERRLQAARDEEEDREFDATFDREENEERLELQEALERKKAAMDPDGQLDKLLAESTYSQPGTLIKVELAMEEANVGDAMPIKAAEGAEDYSQRVEATFRELRDIELDRMRDSATKAKERLTMEDGEEDDEDEEAALEAEVRQQIEEAEGQESGEDSLKRLERLEKKIMDAKWERFLKEEREADKAARLLGATYEPLLMAQKRLISALRNRQLTLDSKLEGVLTDFFAKYEAQYGPGEPEQARIFDKWLAKWVAAENRLEAQPREELAERAQQPAPPAVNLLELPDEYPPVLKDFLAKLSELEKQREAEAKRAQQEWEEGQHLALPAPGEAPPAPAPQEVAPLVIYDGLDAVDIAQKRARELLTQLQTERVEAEVTRQLRSEIAAKDGGWDMRKATAVLRKLGKERREKRAKEWDAVLFDAFECGNLDKYPILVQLEKAAQEQLGLQGALPRGHILWAPLLRPAPPFSATGLAGSPTLPLPFRIGKENLLARLRSDPDSPFYDGSVPGDALLEEEAVAWEAAADAYGGVYRPNGEALEVQPKGSLEVFEKEDAEWEAAKEKGVKWLREVETSILDAEVPGWRQQVAQQGKSGSPFSLGGAGAGLDVLAESPLFDLQVKPADFKDRLAERIRVSEMTGRVFKSLDMKLAPGSDQVEYIYAPKTHVAEDEEGGEVDFWEDPERPAWTPDMSIYSDPKTVKSLVAWHVKKLAKDVPAPSELPPPGASTNFEAAVEVRKKQVLKNLLKKHQPRSYEEVQAKEGKDPQDNWRPGENEFTASVEEVNRFIKSVKEPKDLETTIASLRRVVAAQQEFSHIVERGQALMTSAEQRFVKEFLVPKTVELRALESKLWKDGLLYSTEEPELNRFWKAEWDAREALQAGLAGIFEQPQAKRLMKEREKIDKELDRAYRGLDKVLSEAADRKEDDRASAASRLSDEDYRVPAVDYVGRPVLTGAPEEVGANAEEEWELAYEEMEQVDRNTKIYNWRDEQDERFFRDGLRKAREAIRKLGDTAVFSEDLANFTRTLFKDDLELAKALLEEEDLQADKEDDSDAATDEYGAEELEVEEDDEEEEEDYPQEEGDFWEVLRTQLKATSPAALEKQVAAQKPRVLTLRDVLPDEQTSRIVAEVEAEGPKSKETAVLWNMTEDDETKIDIFSVAPDGKFSKFDTDRLEFLPYANLDQLKVDPTKVQPRPGSKGYKAWLKAEEERKQREAEEKRLREGRDPNELEIDEYGYAVVKTGVEEEEEEEKATGQEWRRQPWYSDEQFFDFLEIPKAAPELTKAHEKEFLLEGAIWKEAARTPWIGDVGEITDPETKKRRVDAAVAAHEAKMRLKVQAGYNTRDDNTLEYMLADDVDEVEKEMLRSYVFKMEKYGEFMATRDKEGKLIVKPVPTPESEEERIAAERREASAKKAQDMDAEDSWSELLEGKEEEEEEPPEQEWWPSYLFTGEPPLADDEDVEDVYLEELPSEESTPGPEEAGEGGEEAPDEDSLDAEEQAALDEAVRKINAGEFVPPRLPPFLRKLKKNLLKMRPGAARSGPPSQEPPRDAGIGKTASISQGALQVLPDYMDAVRWISNVSAEIRSQPLHMSKKLPKCPTASKGLKNAARGKRARSINGGCFSLAVPLGKWTTPEEV